MSNRLTLFIIFLTGFCPALAQESATINKSLTVIHLVENRNQYSKQYLEALKTARFSIPKRYYQNELEDRIFEVDRVPEKSAVIQQLQQRKIPNKIVDYLHKEENGRLSIDRIVKRAEREAASIGVAKRIAGVTDRSTLSEADRLYYSRILNTNYIVVVVHGNISRLEDNYDRQDEQYQQAYEREKRSYPDRLKKYRLEMKRYQGRKRAFMAAQQKQGVSAYVAAKKYAAMAPDKPEYPQLKKANRTRKGFSITHQLYLVKLDLSAETLGRTYFAGMWADSSSSAEAIEAARKFRNGYEYDLSVRNSITEPFQAVWSKEGQDVSSLAVDLLTNGINANSVVNISGSYSESAYLKGLARYLPLEARVKQVTNIEEMAIRRAVESTRPVRANLGREEGARPHMRFDVYRRFMDNKTLQTRYKRIGSLLATNEVTGYRGHTEDTRFYQVYGRRLDLGDQLRENPVKFLVRGGYTTNGVNLGLMLPLPSYGNHLYVSGLFNGMQPSGIDEEIEIDGNTYNTSVSIISGGVGYEKEWHFLRFFTFGPFIGARFYLANFNNNTVEEELVEEETREDYGKDFGLEAGLRFSIRVLYNLSLTATAAYLPVNFNDPFTASDESVFGTNNTGAYPLANYDPVTLGIGIKFDITSFNN